MPDRISIYLGIGLAGCLLPFVLFPQLDPPIFLYLNRSSHFLSEELWAKLTFLGDVRLALSYMSVPVLFALCRFLWKNHDTIYDTIHNSAAKNILHSSKYEEIFYHFGRLVSLLAYGGVMLVLLVQTLKRFFEYQRPIARLSEEAESINVIGEALSHHAFPSGHSATVFFCITMIVAYFGIRKSFWVISLYGLATLVAFSRIAVGAHFLSDILCGSLLGLALAWFTCFLYKDEKMKIQPLYILLALSFSLAVAVSLFFHDAHLPGTDSLIRVSSVIFTICAFLNMSYFVIYYLTSKLNTDVPNGST